MDPHPSRRSAIASGLAISIAAVSGASAASDQQEWPEFRKWYALTQDEEAIYNETPKPAVHDERLTRIGEERDLLEAAMVARTPRSLTDLAVLGVIALYWSDSFGSVGGKVRCLDLSVVEGCATECRKERASTMLVATTIRLALAEGLLPGVEIHGVHSEQASS